MTKAQMEDAIRNLDRRVVNVEQLLPTLATKQDLKDAFDEAKRYADIRVESVRDDIRKVAEGVASLIVKFDQVDGRFDRLEQRIDQRFARVDARLDRMDERFDRIDERDES